MALVNKLTALIAEAQAQDDLVIAQQAEIARLLALIPPAPAPEPAPAPAPTPAPAPEPSPAPAPEPAPAPAPTPAPPPPGAFEVVTEQVPDIRKVMLFTTQHAQTAAYERWQQLHVHTNPGPLTVQLFNLQAGGTRLNVAAGSYVLMVDGELADTVTVTAGTQVTFPAVTLAPGWRRVAVLAPDGTRTPTWFVHSGTAHVDTLIPACTSTYEIYHSANAQFVGSHRWTWVPADAQATASPMQQRALVPFDTALAAGSRYRRQLVPQTTQWRVYRKGEIRTTFGAQSYFFSDLIREFPKWPLLDGPRGRGTLNMPTHVHIGKATKTADPASGPVGALYVTDPWRLVRVNADGSVRTLLGYRHDVAPYWEDALTTKPPLVGNWSAVAGPHGLWECWGFEFDPSTLAVDTSLPPIDGRHPHGGNPTGYLADTRHNRVLKVVFDGRSHETPAVVTEHITGLADPWRVTIDPVRRWLLISERTSHRVVAHDIDTGAFVKVILQGADLAAIDSARSARLRAGVTQLQARNEQIVSPEGLSLRGDWLYVGSMPQQQVRRVNLATDAVEVAVNLPNDGNMRFVDIAVSDGTVGPEHTVFVSTWSNARMGLPMAFLPGGQQWYMESYSATAAHSGRNPWQVLGYSSGVGCGAGRIVFGSSDWGLHEMSKVAATDPVPNSSLIVAGAAQLDPLLYGPGGISPWGLASPRGMSAAVDHLLNVNETV